MKNGVFEMSVEEYRAAEGINKSALDLIRKSPALYERRYLRGAKQPESKTFELGTALHAAVLEPEVWLRDYIKAPAINMRTKDGKAQMAEFQAANEGKIVLAADDFDDVSEQAAAILSHPQASVALSAGLPEQSIFWEDPVTGLQCKARADWLGDDGYLYDLKTTASAYPPDFNKSIANYGYHRQAAFYWDGYMYATGVIPKGWKFIAVEKSTAQVIVVPLAEAAIAQGRIEYQEDLAKYQACLRTNTWPGYDVSEPAQLPGWYQTAEKKASNGVHVREIKIQSA